MYAALSNRLHENYRFVESYTGTLEVGHIVKRMDHLFGNINEELLSSLMKFGFPHCLQITSKNVVHFVGLIEKPLVK